MKKQLINNKIKSEGIRSKSCEMLTEVAINLLLTLPILHNINKRASKLNITTDELNSSANTAWIKS